MTVRTLSIFWIVFYGAFLSGLAISYIPEFWWVTWSVVIFSLLLGVIGMFAVALRRWHMNIGGSDIFFIYTLSFLYAVILSLINEVEVKDLIVGLKNNYQFYPIILFFLIYPFPDRIGLSLIKSVLFVAIIQPPIAIIQYYFVVPLVAAQRENVDSSVLDAVNGTFGVSLQGGGTGVLSIFLSIVLCGLLAAFLKGYLSKKKLLLLYFYLMIPLLINETKVTVILWLLGVMSVLAIEKKISFKKKSLFLISVIIVASIFVIATIKTIEGYGHNLDDILEKTIAYNFGEVGHGGYYLNRKTVLTFWFDKNIHDPLRLLFGYGIDATQEGETGFSQAGVIGQRYYGYGTGLTTISRLLWEVGVLGATLFISLIIVALKKSIMLSRSGYLLNVEKIIAATLVAGFSILLVSVFYNDMLRNSQPGNYFVTLMLAIAILLSRNVRMNRKRIVYSGEVGAAYRHRR